MKRILKSLISLTAFSILLSGCAHTPTGSPASGFFHEGITLFNTGRIDESAILFRRANAADPLFAPAYAMLGRVYLDKGDTYRAEMFFRKSLAIDNTKTEIYGWIGDIYWQEGDHDKAVDFYERCPKDDPHYAVLHYRLGMRAYQGGKPGDARIEFEKALNFPDYWGGHYGLGLLACSDGYYEDAIAHFKSARRDSAEAEIDYWLGKSYYNLGQGPQAFIYCKRYSNSDGAAGELKKEANKIADELEDKITDIEEGLLDTSLVIPFKLDNVAEVAVGIFDLDGNLVKYLFRGSITRGEYTMTWDGTTAGGEIAASGVYLGFVDSENRFDLFPILWKK